MISSYELFIEVNIKFLDTDAVLRYAIKCIEIMKEWFGMKKIELGNYYLRLILYDALIKTKKAKEYLSIF